MWVSTLLTLHPNHTHPLPGIEAAVPRRPVAARLSQRGSVVDVPPRHATRRGAAGATAAGEGNEEREGGREGGGEAGSRGRCPGASREWPGAGEGRSGSNTGKAVWAGRRVYLPQPHLPFRLPSPPLSPISPSVSPPRPSAPERGCTEQAGAHRCRQQRGAAAPFL